MVNITWSLTDNGAAIAAPVDNGAISNGQKTTPVSVYLRHDGANSITNVGLYIREFSGTYSGGATSSNDILEILGWGDATTSSTFGGFQTSFTSSWATEPDETTKDIGTAVYTYRTGVGDSEANAITLPSTTGSGGTGIITAGNTATTFQNRIQVPTSVSTLGIRQWDIVLRFNYTT